MKLKDWLAKRGPAYAYGRARALLDRYGLAPSRAMVRVEGCVKTLAEYGCSPTLPTPGRVVERYPRFFRRLQDMGAEVAVHSYDHVDLAALPLADAHRQLAKATEAFAAHGIEAHGFRCPYLGYTDGLIGSLPEGLFGYSSNQAIRWDVPLATSIGQSRAGVEVLQRLYKPASARDTLCMPWTRPNMVEIPVCVPDDLELHDGLQMIPEAIAEAWIWMLCQTHQRGELFNLLFHPELAERHREAFKAVLGEAARLQPAVWVARLRDVGEWWREKSTFGAVTAETSAGLRISFTCSERATILTRGLDVSHVGLAWDGLYCKLQDHVVDLPAEPRPFVGLPTNAPAHVASFLREQGYIVDTGETARRCGVFIDMAALDRLTSEVELVHHVEVSSAPMVRYGRWPGGAKSALCVSGDLDAISLLDYVSRLIVH